jgi:hypothetical protein
MIRPSIIDRTMSIFDRPGAERSYIELIDADRLLTGD